MVQPDKFRVGGRAIGTLIKTQGVGDPFRLYSFAKRDKMDYTLAAMPTDLAPKNPLTACTCMNCLIWGIKWPPKASPG
jgi:hypothetical protein